MARVDLKKSPGEDALTVGHEGDVDRIVHTAGHHGLETGAVRPAAKDVSGLGFPFFSVNYMRLLSECAFAPVDPPVGARVGAVQIVCATGQSFALEPFNALLRDAIAIFIGKFPNAGGS